ncbi:MAG: AbrB/MazE/SpoVT family DNA-binding domain-containing protein [Candidatus Diapherotrites archaeon]|nr:AbrB/MazE/SpoVT family DNA-binding domain-containing protein [Candidatus Diapherotrites archaeon]
MEVEVVARKWGNSIGVTLPKEAVEMEGIKENEHFFIDIHKEKQATVRDIFGLAKGWKIDSQHVKDELRRQDQ